MATPPLVRIIEREARVYRRLWRGSAFSSFLVPVLFLAAIGVGLGGLVDRRAGAVDGVSYLQFVTPGLLGGMAIQLASGESLWPVMAGVKWVGFFHGVVATPIRPSDLFGGFVCWAAIRSSFSASAFVLVAAILGGVRSPFAVLAVPAAVLTALAFSAPLAAFSATQQTDVSFSVIMRLGIMPLFLFSGTFFPVSELPAWLRPASQLSPLWHGVELCRDATLGRGTPGSIVLHITVLLAIIAASWWWGATTFSRRLAS